MTTDNTCPFSADEKSSINEGISSNVKPTLYAYTNGNYDYGVSRGAGVKELLKAAEDWGISFRYGGTGKRAGTLQKVSDANHQFRASSPAGRFIALCFAHGEDEAVKSRFALEHIDCSKAEEPTEE